MAYLPAPFLTNSGQMKNRLEDHISSFTDPDNHFGSYTRTKLSDLETLYTFTIGENTTDKILGVGIGLVDTTELDYTENCYWGFIIFQKMSQ